jgi:hypothetical protein
VAEAAVEAAAHRTVVEEAVGHRTVVEEAVGHRTVVAVGRIDKKFSTIY